MKKILCLVFVLVNIRSVCCNQTQYQLNISSGNEQINTNKTFGHLKRRYPRKYNLKRNVDRLERDDFGYKPFPST